MHVCIYAFRYLSIHPSIEQKNKFCTVPGKVGPDSWPTDNQQTRKPAKQRTNRPTSQQSNKLKAHQTTRAPDQKLTKKWIQNHIKINQKSNKNQPKIHQKSTKIGLLGALGASCGALGGVLGASWLQEPTSHQKAGSLDPPGPPKLDPKSTKNWLKFVPEAFQKAVVFLIGFGVGFWCHLVPTWLQLGRQKPPKIDPSWSQNPSKKGSRCWPNFCLNFDRSGDAFLSILLRSWKAGGPKNFENP